MTDDTFAEGFAAGFFTTIAVIFVIVFGYLIVTSMIECCTNNGCDTTEQLVKEKSILEMNCEELVDEYETNSYNKERVADLFEKRGCLSETGDVQ